MPHPSSEGTRGTVSGTCQLLSRFEDNFMAETWAEEDAGNTYARVMVEREAGEWDSVYKGVPDLKVKRKAGEKGYGVEIVNEERNVS